MSRYNPFDHGPRRSISALEYARIFARQEGRCAGPCGRKIGVADKPEVDHIVSRACGGTDDESNLQVLCAGCHALKSKGDASTAADIKHSYTQHVVPRRFKRSRSWGRRY